MNWIPGTSLLLRLRNRLHALFPDLCDSLESLRKSEHYRRAVNRSGFVVPLPPFVKRSILRRFITDHRCEVLVETGTQYGDTPWLFRNVLKEIYTVELSPKLARIARERFSKHPHIHIVEGDSGSKLLEILPLLRAKTLFWLDGHYSGGVTAQGRLDCPIYGELKSIFQGCRVPYVILVDDARSFGVEKDYPSLAELEAFVRGALPDASFGVINDIIYIVPAS